MAAELGLSGMDPLIFLREKDPDRLALLQGIAAASREIRERDMHNLAVRIVNGVGELFGGR